VRLLEQNEVNLIQRIVSFVRENESGFELLDVKGPIDFDRRALFKRLSTAGDRDLAIWILRIVIGLEVENYHSDTVRQLQDFIRKRNDSVGFSEVYSSVKGGNFVWELAEQLVAVLVQYTEYNIGTLL
jgi:hypothetical protein